MNFFDHKNLGNHLLQLCPKVVKHPVYLDGTRLELLTPCCWWWTTFYSVTVLCIDKLCWGHQITHDMSRTCSMHGDVKDSCIMVGKPKGTAIWRKFVCEYCIKIDLKYVVGLSTGMMWLRVVLCGSVLWIRDGPARHTMLFLDHRYRCRITVMFL